MKCLEANTCFRREDAWLTVETAVHPDRSHDRMHARLPLPPINAGRHVLVIAVHYVHADGFNYCGGAEKHVLFAVESLLAAGAVVTIAYSGTDIYRDLTLRFSSSQLTVQRVDWLNEVLAGDRRITLSLIMHRWRWLRDQRVDTVYVVQQSSGKAFRTSVLAARLAKLRVVCSLRQAPDAFPAAVRKRWFGIVPKPQWWRRRQQWQYRLPAACANALIYNSATIAQQYEAEHSFATSKRRVVRNGLQASANPRECVGDMRIGYVGRLTAAKGVLLLFDAFVSLAREFPQATLTYFGDGPLRDVLWQRINEQNLSNRVRLAGHISDRRALYEAIDLYIHPSLREAMPNSVLEAMAAGIPTIATHVGGTHEVVKNGETGLLIEPNDSTAIASAIRQLVTDTSLYRRCAANAQQLIATEFDLVNSAARLVQAILNTNG